MVASTAKELSATGRRARPRRRRRRRPDVDRAVAATVEALGGIDILVANAGITGPNCTTWDYPPDAWRQVLDVNLTGVFLCCRAVVPLDDRGRTTAASSTSRRSPARRATRTPRPTARRRRRDRADEVARQGTRRRRHRRELHHAGRGARPRIFDQMTQEHIDYMLSKIRRGGFCDRRGRLAGRLARLRGEYVHDRRGVRSQRRPRNVLTVAGSDVRLRVRACGG